MLWLCRHLTAFLASLAALCLLAATANAAELLMFTRKSCPYCVLWERQVGPIYPKTDEARIAPLRRIDLDAPPADTPALTPVVNITPTFVLMQEGREIGRFSGYSDDMTFWARLEILLKSLETRPKPAYFSLPETAK